VRRLACSIAVSLAAIVAYDSTVASDDAQKRVAFSILEDYDKGDDLADVAKDFALFREAGDHDVARQLRLGRLRAHAAPLRLLVASPVCRSRRIV
jgi:hypothetical protein